MKLRKYNITNQSESSKKTIVVCIVIGTVMACILFMGGMMILDPIVDDYLSKKQVSYLYNFYDLKMGEKETAIYFIGNSQIGSNAYVPLIEHELDQRGYSNISLYNLYQSAETPIYRLLQVESMISSKPSMVIYGISPWIFVEESGWVDESVILVSDRIHLNSSAEKYYTDEELADIRGGGDVMFKKRFLRGALVERFHGPSELFDPITYTKEEIFDPWTSEEKKMKYSNLFGKNGCNLSEYIIITESHVTAQRNNIPRTPFTAEENRNLFAFEFILQRFTEEDIPVVLVVMPEHSIINELTPDISETNLHEYLTRTGLHWYDLDEMYGDEIMSDLVHVHWDGAVQLAPVWADIIIEEVKSGAVHYA